MEILISGEMNQKKIPSVSQDRLRQDAGAGWLLGDQEFPAADSCVCGEDALDDGATGLLCGVPGVLREAGPNGVSDAEFSADVERFFCDAR